METIAAGQSVKQKPGIGVAIVVWKDAAKQQLLLGLGHSKENRGEIYAVPGGHWESGETLAEAVKRGGGGRLVLAWDVDQETLDAIKSGVIDATIAQKPFSMGYVGLKALDEVFHNPPKQLGKDFGADAFAPYPSFVDTGTALVDKNNGDLYSAAQAEGTH